jgi:hypothetical protein
MKFSNILFISLAIFILMSINFVSSCMGCEFEGECYGFGEIINHSYCDYNTTNFTLQKGLDEFCINDFECLENLTCTENICFNLIEGLITLDEISDQLNDTDGDFILNFVDNCINEPNYDQSNPDGDLFGSSCDNCPTVPNNDQNDSDGDGIGDLCNSSSDEGEDSSDESRATYKIYTLNPLVFERGYTAYLREGDKIRFRVNGEYHTLEFMGIYGNKVKVELKSKTFNIELYLNQIQKFDLNSNGYYDLSVLLKAITEDTSKAKITIKQLNEKTRENTASETIMDDGSLDNGIDGTGDVRVVGVSEKTYLKLIVWVFLITTLVLILISLSVLLFKEKRNARIPVSQQQNIQKRTF